MEGTFLGTNPATVRAAFRLGIHENYDAPALNRMLRTSLKHLHPDKMQHARNPLRARHLAWLIYDGLRYLKEDLEHAERRRDPDFAPSVDAPTPESWPEYMSEDFATAAGAETETFTPPEQTPGLRRNTGQGGGGRDTGTMWAGDEGAAWCPEGEDVPGVDPEVDWGAGMHGMADELGCLNAFSMDELCQSRFNHVTHVPREAMELWATTFCNIEGRRLDSRNRGMETCR